MPYANPWTGSRKIYTTNMPPTRTCHRNCARLTMKCAVPRPPAKPPSARATKPRNTSMNSQIEHNDLRTKIQAAQEHIEELEEQLAAVEALETENAGLEADVEDLRNLLGDHERTLIVKDERISHLETQFQKERQRNLHHADAVAALRTATASPVDEPPPSFNLMADSLQEELDAVSDYDESLYQHLDFSDVTNVAEIAPIAPAPKVTTAPTAAARSTIRVAEAASVVPTTAPAPKHTLNVNEAAQVAPVTAPTPKHTLNVNEAAQVAPLTAPAPKLSVKINETINFAPETIPTPEFTVYVNEAASITPIQRQVAITAVSTQTDIPELTVEIPPSAALDIAPIAPVEVVLSSSSTQTHVPKLHSSVVGAATISIAPIEPKEMDAKLDTTLAPTAASNQKLDITAIEVMFEEVPSLGHAERHLNGSMKGPAIEAAQSNLATNDSNKTSFSQTALALIALLLTLVCLKLYTELSAWRTANGIGFGEGYGNVYDRGGAFGNGRHLFGVIPLAMDVGNSDLSEQVARTMSVAITRFEDWAGISRRILY